MGLGGSFAFFCIQSQLQMSDIYQDINAIWIQKAKSILQSHVYWDEHTFAGLFGMCPRAMEIVWCYVSGMPPKIPSKEILLLALYNLKCYPTSRAGSALTNVDRRTLRRYTTDCIAAINDYLPAVRFFQNFLCGGSSLMFLVFFFFLSCDRTLVFYRVDAR